MKKNNGFLTIILTLIVIVLIAIIGIFGYIIYEEITGEGNIKINFDGEAGYPIIEYKKSSENKVNTNETIFSGVEGNNSNTNTDSKKQYRHLYNQLNQNAKIIYSKLYENKENLKTGTYTIEFGDIFSETLSKENGDKELQKDYQSAIEALIYENPDIFYLNPQNMYINIETITKLMGVKYNVYINKGTKINYLAEGFYSKEDVDRCQKEIEQIKDEIVLRIGQKSDYEKIKLVHDYLVESIEYDKTVSGEHIYNIYGALISKKCVCEGYAKAFQYLMNEVGIDNTIVIGTGTNSNNETENHAWNYVKLDGNWYAIDVTWDDPIVIGGGKLSPESKHRYFLKGNQTISKNHTPSGQFTEEGQIFEYPILNETDYR